MNWNVIFRAGLGLLLGLLTTPLRAAVELPNGLYHHTVEDLSVKLPGGSAVITRTWYQGQWHLNRSWNDLIFRYDSLSGQVQGIEPIFLS